MAFFTGGVLPWNVLITGACNNELKSPARSRSWSFTYSQASFHTIEGSKRDSAVSSVSARSGDTAD